MKVRATLMAVATAIALSGTANAVPITIYGASQEYTAKVAKWYDEAPQALRSKINPLLMTFDNTHTLATLYTSWGIHVCAERGAVPGLGGSRRGPL
jgi:hypothetical protein